MIEYARSRLPTMEDNVHVPESKQQLADWTPRQRHQDPTLHLLDQRHCLVHGIAPPPLVPALLPSYLSFPQIRKLPQMVYRVETPDLAKPGADTLHDILACLEATAPVGFPLKKVTRSEGIGAELKDPTEIAWGRCRPEGKFLH